MNGWHIAGTCALLTHASSAAWLCSPFSSFSCRCVCVCVCVCVMLPCVFYSTTTITTTHLDAALFEEVVELDLARPGRHLRACVCVRTSTGRDNLLTADQPLRRHGAHQTSPIPPGTEQRRLMMRRRSPTAQRRDASYEKKKKKKKKAHKQAWTGGRTDGLTG